MGGGSGGGEQKNAGLRVLSTSSSDGGSGSVTDKSNSLRFFATTVRGLESLCREEVEERYAQVSDLQVSDVWVLPGIVLFTLTSTSNSTPPPPQILSAFRLGVLVAAGDHLPDDTEGGLRALKSLGTRFAWGAAERAWRGVQPRSDLDISFRVNCVRKGTHAYKSPTAAGWLGAGIIKTTGWAVDLTKFNLEIYLHIAKDQWAFGVTLVPDQTRQRNRAPVIMGNEPVTPLAPPCASLLVRAAHVQPGHVVVDPMCGDGTIPIEGSLAHPSASFIAADINHKSIIRARRNAAAAARSQNVPEIKNLDIKVWDATQTGLAEGSIDTVISDLPYGQRHGSHKINVDLYPPFVSELARITKPGGQALLLTLERYLVRKLATEMPEWELDEAGTFSEVDIGGFDCGLLRLVRTNATFDEKNTVRGVTVKSLKEEKRRKKRKRRGLPEEVPKYVPKHDGTKRRRVGTSVVDKESARDANGALHLVDDETQGSGVQRLPQ